MLTTQILLDNFEQTELKIIKQTKKFRYSFLFGNKKLKLVALSHFPNTKNTKIISVKRKISSGDFIGEMIQSRFKNFEKRLTHVGTFFLKSSDLEIHEWKSQHYRYTLSNIEINLKKRNHLFCEVLEIYSGDFYEDHIKATIKKPEFLNVNSLLFLEAFKYGFTLT